MNNQKIISESEMEMQAKAGKTSKQAVPYVDMFGRRLTLKKDLRKAVTFFLCVAILMAATFGPASVTAQNVPEDMLSSESILQGAIKDPTPEQKEEEMEFPPVEWNPEPTIQGEMIFFDPNFWYNNGFSGATPLTEPVVQGQIKVACVGDSLTYGYGVMNWEENNYPAQLQNMLGSSYHVQNFGMSNYCVKNDSNLPYTSLETYTNSLAYEADVLVFMMGSNDAKTINWTTAEDYKAALCELLDSYGDVQVILCTPSTCLVEEKTVYGHQVDKIAEVAQVMREVAQERGYMLVDFYEQSLTNPQWFTLDGVHLNVEGAANLALSVREAIARLELN